MSEFLAEAAVAIRADATMFRTQLAALLAETKKLPPVVIPVVATGGSLGAFAAESGAAKVAAKDLAGANVVAAASMDDIARAAFNAGVQIGKTTAVEKTAAAATRRSAAQRSEALKGIQAQTLSFAGLRGAIIGANPAFLAATASVIAFGAAIKQAVSLQTQLNVFAATAGATADQMARVGEAAKQLGQDVTLPAVSTADAAEAMTELSKAGLSVEDALGGARGVLQLATAAAIDNAQATELAASAINAFGLAGSDATHVADVLANAANSSQGSISDMGVALQQSAAVARQAGLSLEDTVAVLTLFARNGLRGSDAGTSFRTMLLRLINPTEKAQKVIDRLGLSIRDSTGAINLGIFDDFRRATEGFTTAQRDQAAAVLFGTDAIRGFLIGVREGNRELARQTEINNRAGAAQELAAARTKGLAGAMENLRNQLSTAGTALGTSFIPALTGLADTASVAIQQTQGLLGQIAKLREEATKPIEFAIKLIPVSPSSVGGGEGKGFKDRVAGFVDDFVNTLPGQITAATGNVQHLLDIFRQARADFQQVLAQRDLPGLVEQINTSGGSLTVLNQVVQRLQKFEKEMRGGSTETEAFRKNLLTFIEQLQKLSAQPPVVVPVRIEIPKALSGETVGRDAGQSVIDGLRQRLSSANVLGITQPFFERLGSASTTSSERFTHTGELTAQEFGRRLQLGLSQAFLQSVSAVNQGARSLTDAMNRAVIAGAGEGTLRSILQQQLDAQNKIIADANARIAKLPPGPSAARKKALDIRSAALGEAADITGQIEQIDQNQKQAAEQAINKRKQDAAELRRKRESADSDFIDALTLGRAPIERKITRAEGTETLVDDIKRQQQLRSRLLAEIVAISNRAFVDAKEKAKAISDRRDQIEKILATIGTLRTKQQTAAQENAKKARDAITDALGKRIQLAELRGGKDAVLAAFDKAIADAKKRVANWKKLGLVQLDEQIALATLVKDRKDFLENLEKDVKEGQGTTAFDLLKQFSETFSQNAGNLINASQPFAGPSGFTADIAQFLIRRPQPQRPVTFPGKAADNTLVQSNTSLTQAIDRLADVIIDQGKGGNTTTGPVTKGNPWAGRRWFGAADEARRVQEG